jgi:hypothetical protein
MSKVSTQQQLQSLSGWAWALCTQQSAQVVSQPIGLKKPISFFKETDKTSLTLH